jgi:hypothetical protein
MFNTRNVQYNLSLSEQPTVTRCPIADVLNETPPNILATRSHNYPPESIEQYQ